MGDKTLTSLPLDVLRSIWHYLILPDVIRFGMTTNNMLNLTWPYYQEISMAGNWPINALSFILSRDLSHVRSLELYHHAKRSIDLGSAITSIIQQLKSLKFSKLSSLHTLIVDLEFPKEFDDARKSLDCINVFIFTNTQLQDLSWYAAQVEDDFNIGQFFVEHTRLTRLIIQTEKKIIGFHKLTQLKELHISLCDNLDDDTLLDVVRLTQLRFLDCSNENVTDQSFTRISNLTNLEGLEMNHNDRIASTSLNLLSRLPNLSQCSLYYPLDLNEEFSAAASIIGQLSRLTYLWIHNCDGELDFNALSNLTNLMELNIDAMISTTVDFSNFLKLTSLDIYQKFKLAALPPNLECLSIAEELTNTKYICSLTKLRRLYYRSTDFDASAMIPWISHLTSLSTFSLNSIAPKGLSDLIPALRQLPNLAGLTFSSLPCDDKIIEELTKLTQVRELTYWNGYQKNLKAKLPFNVRFSGSF